LSEEYEFISNKIIYPILKYEDASDGAEIYRLDSQSSGFYIYKLLPPGLPHEIYSEKSEAFASWYRRASGRCLELKSKYCCISTEARFSDGRLRYCTIMDSTKYLEDTGFIDWHENNDFHFHTDWVLDFIFAKERWRKD
jgi:hypothetical protein